MIEFKDEVFQDDRSGILRRPSRSKISFEASDFEDPFDRL